MNSNIKKQIPYLLEQAPRCLLNFSRLKCGAYLKIGRHKEKKNGENRLLAQVTGKGREELGLLSR